MQIDLPVIYSPVSYLTVDSKFFYEGKSELKRIHTYKNQIAHHKTKYQLYFLMKFTHPN